MPEQEVLTCPDCPETFAPRRAALAPESWRGVRQRVVKHRRKRHGYPGAEQLRAGFTSYWEDEAAGMEHEIEKAESDLALSYRPPGDVFRFIGECWGYPDWSPDAESTFP